MAFPRDQVAELLVKCHRRCCICHRFCGVKIETDHIEPHAENEDDRIDNAIPVCFECHAEIHSYNDSHPKGRKFTPAELRQHRDQWLKVCKDRPEVLLAAAWNRDVGPLQALTDELEFNDMVAAASDEQSRGALFQDAQFRRAIQEGMVAILEPTLKAAILAAYVAISRANQHIQAEVSQDVRMKHQGTAAINARDAIQAALPCIRDAGAALNKFLAKS